jgi:pimeloyl-ACP methyl ester carboxylesterase
MRIQVDDIRMYFDVEGSKLRPHGKSMRQMPTLLLIHGGPGFDHSGFKPAFAEVAAVAQVVYLDLRGNGRSDAGPEQKWSLEQWAQDVHSFCDALSIENPIVLGHSLGGIVAMVYALRFPDHPAKLVLSSTSTQPTIGERSFAVFERLGGPRARAAAMAFWTKPDDSSFAEYEAVCIPLYTRGPHRRLVSMSERCAIPRCSWCSSNPNCGGWICYANWIESNAQPWSWQARRIPLLHLLNQRISRRRFRRS